MKSLHNKIREYAFTHCKRVPPKSIINAEFTLDNGGCHHNSVAAARAGRADKVWLVIADTDDGPIVHFINSKGSKFFDETWHERDHPHHYYIIKEVDKCEWSEVYTLLMATKRTLIRMFGTAKQMEKLRKGKLRL